MSSQKEKVRIDFHVHTNYSPDAIISPSALMRKAKDRGIIPAITDHNHINAHDTARELAKKYNISFIPGEEIRTDAGDLIALYLNEAIEKNTRFLDALDRIKEQGALSYLPHMYDITRKGVSIQELAKKVDIVEAFNARCPLQDYNRQAWEFAKKHKLPTAAGSDSHFLFEFGTTYVELNEFDLDSPQQLIKSLSKSKITGKKAPLFVRGSTLAVKFAKRFFRSSL